MSATDKHFSRGLLGWGWARARWVDSKQKPSPAPPNHRLLFVDITTLEPGLGLFCSWAAVLSGSLDPQFPPLYYYCKNNNITPVKGLKKKERNKTPKPSESFHPNSTAALIFLSCSSLCPCLQCTFSHPCHWLGLPLRILLRLLDAGPCL